MKWFLALVQKIDPAKLQEAWKHIMALLNLFPAEQKFAAGPDDEADAEQIRALCKSAGVPDADVEKALQAARGG